MICSIHNLIEKHLTNEIMEIPKTYYYESTFRVSIHFKNDTCLQQAKEICFGMDFIREKIVIIYLYVC